MTEFQAISLQMLWLTIVIIVATGRVSSLLIDIRNELRKR